MALSTTAQSTTPGVQAGPGVAAERFREAMSKLASGVVVVVADVSGRPWGMTVSAACPICIEPPTMLVSLSSHTVLARAVADTGRFGVNVLGDGAIDLARFGSTVGSPKFLDDGVGLDLRGSHPAAVALEGALSHLDCDVVEEVVHGTHSIFLGRVREISGSTARGPLVHYLRGFWRVGEEA